jgi:hypothetical protein
VLLEPCRQTGDHLVDLGRRRRRGRGGDLRRRLRQQRGRHAEPGIETGRRERQREREDQRRAPGPTPSFRSRDVGIGHVLQQATLQLGAGLRMVGGGEHAGREVAIELGELVAVDAGVDLLGGGVALGAAA